VSHAEQSLGLVCDTQASERASRWCDQIRLSGWAAVASGHDSNINSATARESIEVPLLNYKSLALTPQVFRPFDARTSQTSTFRATPADAACSRTLAASRIWVRRGSGQKQRRDQIKGSKPQYRATSDEIHGVASMEQCINLTTGHTGPNG
jgi:hypothetical protein